MMSLPKVTAKVTAKIAVIITALLTGSAPVCRAADDGPERRLVEIENPLATSQPLQGYLRQPRDPGPSPAVVLLHGCNGGWQQLDERWGARIGSWGYVTLTVDRFGPRGIISTCTGGAPPATVFDAYRALTFLAQRPFVDPDRVAVIGFSQGGWLALTSVERGMIERTSKEKFRAAVAFYPPCLGLKDSMTVPTLILVGELDDWTPANECRNLAEGRDDYGISRAEGPWLSDRACRLSRRLSRLRYSEPCDAREVSRPSPRIQPDRKGPIHRRTQEIPVCDNRRKRETPVTIKAIVFDAYGTLYDVQSVADVTEDAFPGYGGIITQVWRIKQLEYTWLRSLMRRYQDFSQVTRDSLAYTLRSLGLEYDDDTFARIIDKYLHLDLYPDALAALSAMKDRKLAILSNGSPDMLGALVRNSGLDRLLDATISVDAKKIFKPSPEAYTLIEEVLHVPPAEVLFISSNPWDACGAKAFGLNVAWIERVSPEAMALACIESETLPPLTMFKILRTQMDELGVAPDHRIHSLSELPALVSA